MNKPIDLGPVQEISLEKLAAGLEKENEFENVPRTTLLKLIQTCDYDVDFVFKVQPNEAENYIGAMRAVLSRLRKKIRGNKQRAKEFKLKVMEIQHLKSHDLVTVRRCTSASFNEKSVYDELVMAFAQAEEKGK